MCKMPGKSLFIVLLVGAFTYGFDIEEGYTKCDHLQCICSTYEDQNRELLFHVDCSLRSLETSLSVLELPSALGTLDLSQNRIEKLDNSTNLTSEHLQMLNFESNRISYLSDGYFENVKNLKLLNLDNNRIENISREMFRGLTKLDTLKIGRNKIKTIANDVFMYLPNLRELSLDNNRNLGLYLSSKYMKDILPANVSILRLDGIDIEKIPPLFFYGLNELEFLTLSNNPLQELPHLRKIKLKYLDMSGSNITNFTCTRTRLFSLQHLRISNMPHLTNIQEYAFNDFVSLRSLIIDNCPKLRQISPHIFGHLSFVNNTHKFALEQFSLANNELTELSFGFRYIFKHLKEINLSDNPWNCDCRLLWLQEFSDKIIFNNTLRCYNPEPLRNKSVLGLELEKFSCFQNKFGNIDGYKITSWLFPLLGSLSVIIIVLVVLLVYLGPYGKPNQYWTRTIGPGSPYMPITFKNIDYV